LNNQVQAILQRNLVPKPPVSGLFGIKGRCWLANQPLPPDEELAVEALLRQLEFHGQELRIIDAELGRLALESEEVKRLITIPGLDATIALSIVAAVGDFQRFAAPGRLVSYLGLNPRVRQSGGQPASHGRITKHGRAHARGMLVEAAWVAVRTPGPSRAFYERIRSGRGMQIAVVATAQARGALLAFGHQKRELCTRAPVADRQEAPRARAARRDARPPRQQGQRGSSQPQDGPPARARALRASRTCIPPARR
jgi:transposase